MGPIFFACWALTNIFNKSLESGEVPKQWKRAHVSPIFKKGDKKQSENYRPVSLTCVVCKTMESLVRDKLMSHIESNRLFQSINLGLEVDILVLPSCYVFLRTGRGPWTVTKM